MMARNPLGFTPYPVTIICSIVFVAFFSAILVVHHTVPSAPKSDIPLTGINISEAFRDLQTLTTGYHPYNSRRNDDVRNWLLSRIEAILDSNGAEYTTIQSPDEGPPGTAVSEAASVIVFNDLLANVSFHAEFPGNPATSTYFEGTNIIVYVRGKADQAGNWWNSTKRYDEEPGVLVNAHYDSVSTSYGATDDGVGVVTVLQLLKFFSTEGHRPKHGILFLLNNGEEDFLNGARAFTKHPTAKFANRFLNLEGAGAGGRAALFRSTDAEVTRYYQRARYPFASSISDDGFKRGIVRSDTDYRVFAYESLDMRGLDVAFLAPRARYHTSQDDARHTNRDSLWHMLSAALPTMQGLAGSELREMRSEAAWFDLFGRYFVVMELHTLFALQVTLLVVAPMSLIVVLVVLASRDKLYLFSRYKELGEYERAPLGGWKGAWRAPLVFVVSSTGTVAIALLITKVNAFIVMSSPWSVWTSLLTIWICLAWFQLRFADYIRPTALHRAYTLGWLHLAVWVLAVAAAASENDGLSSGYPILFYGLGLWLATLLALLEQFGLSRRSTFASEQLGQSDEFQVEDAEQDEPSEDTALLHEQQQTSFRPQSRRTEEQSIRSGDERKPDGVYEYEQWWSHKLPSSLWLPQFLLVSVSSLLFIGPIATFVTFALAQTLSDGNSPMPLYMLIAFLSILLVAPLQPFLHRSTYHLHLFLILAFAGTLIYNLTAFPFSSNNKLKLYFVQEVDLDSGRNNVMIRGADISYIKAAVGGLPSAAGKELNITARGTSGTFEARWPGVAPTVVQPIHRDLPPELAYEHWLTLNVTRLSADNRTATFALVGKNTRNCRLQFKHPISDFAVEGSDMDTSVYKRVPDEGSNEIRLWRRDWETPWTVQVKWEGPPGLDGQATCLWTEDEDTADGGIPALKEFRLFAPTWAAVTKDTDGLVMGSKRFMV